MIRKSTTFDESKRLCIKGRALEEISFEYRFRLSNSLTPLTFTAIANNRCERWRELRNQNNDLRRSDHLWWAFVRWRETRAPAEECRMPWFGEMLDHVISTVLAVIRADPRTSVEDEIAIAYQAMIDWRNKHLN